MKIEVQLICFFISFLYGILINFCMRVHRKLLKKAYLVSKILIYFLATFIMVIMYVDVLFFINNGNFHIYFMFMIILGFFAGRKFTNKM